MALPPLLLTPEGIQAAVHGAPRNRGETVSVQTLFGKIALDSVKISVLIHTSGIHKAAHINIGELRVREKVTQEAFRQFRSLLQCKPAGHPAQFPVSGRSGPVRCAPIDFNDLRRYTVRIIFTLNAAVCAFQAELVYTIGHPQTDRRSCGNTAARKINMTA